MVRPSSARRALLFSVVLATVLTAFAYLSPPALGDHDTLAWRYAGTASSSNGFDAGQATVFTDRAGHLYVFYTNTSTTTGLSNLHVTKFATRGSSNTPVWLFDRRVNGLADSIFPNIEPSVAMEGSGALYVAYSEFRAGSNRSNAEVYVSKSMDGGATWGLEVRANALEGFGEDTSPSLAVAPNGNVFVAWIQSWDFAQNVSASVSTDHGVSFGNVRNITGVPRSSVTTASVTTDSRSRAYVVYDDHDLATDQFTVNFTWSDDGVSWSPPRTLSGPVSNIYLPIIKADPAGRLHLAWFDTLGLTSQVWYSRSDDRGATWTPPVTVSQNAADAVVVGARMSIGVSGGTLMVAWTADQGNLGGLAFAVSADGGDRWSSERFVAVPNIGTTNAVIDADENGTFYAAPTQVAGSPTAVFLEYWYGPPTAPAITTIGRGTGQLDVRWARSPEPSVVGYRIWRSSDGVSYTIVASVAAPSTNHTDRGLANGTYWYAIEAVNDQGIPSHRSAAARATVGPSAEDQIADLLAQIAALKAELAKLNSSGPDAAALQARIDELQSRLNRLQPEAADQTMAFVNAGLLVVAITLLALVVLLQSRKPKPQPAIVLPQHRFRESDLLRSEELEPEKSANLPLPGFEDDL